MHGQFVVEREFLGHVADERFDAVGFARHVVPGNGRATVARLQQTAEHPNHSRFTGTVRAEKTEDGTFRHRERNVINGRELAEISRTSGRRRKHGEVRGIQAPGVIPDRTGVGLDAHVRAIGERRSSRAFINMSVPGFGP